MQNRAIVEVIGRSSGGLAFAVACGIALCTFPAHAQGGSPRVLPGHIPAAVARFQLQPTGRLAATNQLSLAIGLPLRNEAALNELFGQLYDPRSTNFHKFLTPEQFAEKFGPAELDYQAVIQFAESNGLAVARTHPNRVVLDVEGSVSNIERAFHTTLRTYRHPSESRDFFAPDSEPSVPASLSVVTIEGLSDFQLPKPQLHKVDPQKIQPLAGSGPGGGYAGNDFRNAYTPGTTLNGAGQSVGLLEFSSYYKVDITNYENTIGMSSYVPLNNVVIGRRAPGTANNDEVALDIEMAIAMAPGLSQVIVYESSSSASSILSRMANDNLAKQLSSSWTWGGGPSTTIDNIFKQMAAQGQSYFQASGDSDAYTGSQPLDSGSTAPVDSTNITCVGGTTLTMNGAGDSWAWETVWNWNSSGQPNVGSSGGISAYYTIPWWQTNVNMTANSGSADWRNIPDVALTADNVFVNYNNGGSGNFGGTSCAAPLWAGFCALINQQSIAVGGTTVGFLNPALYAIADGPNYANCFHDITSGNNVGTGTPGLFFAVSGYDLCTGLGTPNGTNLINALAPLPTLPYLVTQPSSQIVTNGANVTFSVNADGQTPLNFQWLFNGASLSSVGNVSGATSNTLSLTAATTNNTGNYSLLVSNSFGSITSSIAVLNVGFAPAFSAQPANLTVLSGSNAVFNGAVNGSAPLIYQWRKNGAILSNGGNVSGTASNVLTFTAVTTNNSGNYTLAATNIFGVTTSSVAMLTVVLPPAITISLTNKTIQCGSNATFSVAATGTPPLNYQWSFDNVAISGATNTGLSLTNVHVPNHIVAVIVTNLYGAVTNIVTLFMQDTLAPVVALNGSNTLYVELGGLFVDPGATAYDLCAGAVPVTTSGAVNASVVGTNIVIYTASDGVNSVTNTRTVIVRDTTPPAILWSFTNLTLAAGTDCAGAMPDVTGTNFIFATDLSGTLNVSQSPPNAAILPLGTNAVIITVADASGNQSFSTNQIIVHDETPPGIFLQPQSQTNTAGATVVFSVGASACTALTFQWYSNNISLDAETNGTLVLPNVTTGAAGNYFAAISAAGGSTNSSVATLTVNLISPALTLAASESPSGFRDNVDFAAIITPANSTGMVQFLTNGAPFDIEPLVAGTAFSTNISSLPRGTNLITAIYSGDANDSPATNTLAQIVTNHPPVAADVYYDRLAGYPLAIAVADIATNWSEADGDSVSLAAIGVSTNGVTVTNNAGILAYYDTNNVDDQFVCTITDGWGGTNFQNIFVNIVLTNTTPRIISVGYGSTNGLTLDLSGAPNHTYILEATTNLLLPAFWSPLDTNTLDISGVWQFNDSAATNFQQRFYRLRLSQ